MNAPRLMIADDSELMRQAIESVLDREYDVVASVPDGDTAISRCLAMGSKRDGKLSALPRSAGSSLSRNMRKSAMWKLASAQELPGMWLKLKWPPNYCLLSEAYWPAMNTAE